MPKSKSKGGKNRRRGKNDSEEKHELVAKEDGQEYAKVVKMLGNGRLTAQCYDGKDRLCHIRGKMRKKVWINQGDIVLIGLREYQDGKADVILKYSPDEARRLKALGELPENAQISAMNADGDDEDDEMMAFDFEECVPAGRALVLRASAARPAAAVAPAPARPRLPLPAR